MKNVLLALAALLVSAQLVAAGPDLEGAKVGQWTMDLDAAQPLAAAQKLPLFLNFTGSDWCGWCKLMDKQVFSQAGWTAYATQSVVMVWIDFPHDESLVPEKYRERNKALGERYGVEGYPTYVVLDADGKTELGRLGADRDMTPEVFIQKLKDVLGNRADALDALVQEMGPERGAAFREKATRLAAARGEKSRIEADSRASLKKLAAEIETLDRDVQALRTDWKRSKLTDEQRQAYDAANQAYEAQQEALKAWLAAKPERSEENQQKFTELTKKLKELEQARNAALKGS